MRSFVFISHTHADSEVAGEIRAILEREGVHCWVAEQQIEWGDDYVNSIMRAIKECVALVLVGSAVAAESQHVLAEVQIAFDADKKIYPIGLEPDIHMRFQYPLVRTQWMDGSKDLEENVRKLAGKIQDDFSDVSTRRRRKFRAPRRGLGGSKLGKVAIAALLLLLIGGAAWWFRSSAPDPVPTPPQASVRLKIIRPAPGEVFGGGPIRVEGVIEGELKDVAVFVDGKEAGLEGARFAADFHPSKPGPQVIEVSASGKGGEAVSNSVSVSVDSSPPIIEFDPDAEHRFVTRRATAQIRGRVLESDELDYLEVNGRQISPDARGYFAAPVELPTVGEHEFTFRARDMAGNEAQVRTIVGIREEEPWKEHLQDALEASRRKEWKEAERALGLARREGVPEEEIPRELSDGLKKPTIHLESPAQGERVGSLLVGVRGRLERYRAGDLLLLFVDEAGVEVEVGRDGIFKATARFKTYGKQEFELVVRSGDEVRARQSRSVTLEDVALEELITRANEAAKRNEWDLVAELIETARERGALDGRIPKNLKDGVERWEKPPEVIIDEPEESSTVRGPDISVAGRLITGRTTDQLYIDGEEVQVKQRSGHFRSTVRRPRSGKTSIQIEVRGGSRRRRTEEISLLVVFPPAEWAKGLLRQDQLDAAAALRLPVAFENDLGMRFVLIPGGKFAMGAPSSEARRMRDTPPRVVDMKSPYYMQITETTAGQFRSMDPKHQNYDWEYWDPEFTSNGDAYPVNNIDALKAMHYAEWLSTRDKDYFYRLPTEAEWECAVRAGTRTKYWWADKPLEAQMTVYANVPDLTMMQWFQDHPVGKRSPDDFFNGRDRYTALAPVGNFKPNPWGLFDMLGNVAEWCVEFSRDLVADPRRVKTGSFVSRGGSCYFHREYVREMIRPAARNEKQGVGPESGFRLVAIPRSATDRSREGER